MDLGNELFVIRSWFGPAIALLLGASPILRTLTACSSSARMT